MAIPEYEFWGSNYYDNPPLTEDAIKVAESQLGVTLPREYLRLLWRQNGGYTKRFAFPMTQRTSWAADHVPFDSMAGIVTDPDHTDAHSILQTEYMTREWGLPPRQVLLDGDGHWWITLDYRQSNSPSVAWIDVEIGEDIQIASSFSEFLEGLVPESEFDSDES